VANILIENAFDWKYDGVGKWDFYKSDNYYQYNDSSEFYFEWGPEYISILGTGLKYKADGKGSDGSTQHVLTGGTVTGFVVSYKSSHTYVNGISLDAKQLHTLMTDGSSAASAKIFAATLAGDDDVTLGFGSDRFATFGGDDVVRGRAGNDWINAGSGDVVLSGGTGKDTLIGGSGQDYFVFDTKASSKNIDVIDDFSVKDDTIILDHLIYRGVGKAGDLAASAFFSNTTGKAADASDRIIYNSKTGGLFYDSDGTGKTAAIQFAVVDPSLKLTASDFDII
jgi:Ca2+-binding RTX toxin-like protein